MSITHRPRSRSVAARPLIALASILLGASPGIAQLNRADAVNALLAPGSGVPLSVDSSVWSPYVDFGAGPGFEGLLPAGSAADPAYVGELPFPGPGPSVSVPSYFFWINDAPASNFQHPTRFVLVDANNPSPTVGNGGILVSDQGWWPVITTPFAPATEYFATLQDRVTDFPSGDLNPDGHIAGPVASNADIFIVAPVSGPRGGGTACALLVRGDPSVEFGNDLTRAENDLKTVRNVPAGRIIKANSGNAASAGDIDTAITSLCNLSPDCTKIYVRMTSHGSVGSYSLRGGSISAADLCAKFRKLAMKGVPICMLINGCNTGSLLDTTNWDFPAGSIVITAAQSGKQSWGSATPFREDPNDPNTAFSESLLPYSFSKCMRDPNADTDGDGKVSDLEAFRWVVSVKPCYLWTRNNTRWYPAGPPTGTPGENPGPSVREVGVSPTGLNYNVRNSTGQQKTDFHICFRGDVRGGYGVAWRSNQNDQIGARWSGATVTYDPNKDETCVSWANAGDPIANGQWLHVGYFKRGLKPLRQWWTPTTATPAQQDRVPSQSSTVRPNEDGSSTARIVNRDALQGGWAVDSFFDITYRIAPFPIPLDNLNLGDPLVSGLPPVPVGSVALAPGEFFEFPLPPIPPDARIILQVTATWSLNGNPVMMLDQIDPSNGGAPPCLGDFDGDGMVGLSDLGFLLGCWQQPCGDLTGDGNTDLADLGVLLGNWGPCPPPIIGACCLPTGGCIETTLDECLQIGGVFQGPGTPCDVFCPPPVSGACCLPDGNCVETTGPECDFIGGIYFGDGSLCTPNLCGPSGAGCCFPDGSCQNLDPNDCIAQGGTPLPIGQFCDAVGCTPFGACCFSDGTCQDLLEGDCSALGGTFQGGGTTCANTVCFAVLVPCCFGDGLCIETDPNTCINDGGNPGGPGETCNTISCPQFGACCLPDGFCVEVSELECQTLSGVFQGGFTNCFDTVCLGPVGACCFSDGTCQELPQFECGGVFQGAGVPCSPDPCPAVGIPGACCLPDGNCQEVLDIECASLGGVFGGDFTTCADVNCAGTGACCLPDGNCVNFPLPLCIALNGQFQGFGTTCGPTTCP